MRLLTIFILAIFIAACGKTGKLYLPDDAARVEEPASQGTEI